MRLTAYKHKFVNTVPENLEDGMLYVALDYRTVIHKCFCGCGSEVVTALSPTDWKLIYDGLSVSLYPSVGNWALNCRSHYWVEKHTVKWAGQWSQSQIEAVRASDRLAKSDFYCRPADEAQAGPEAAGSPLKPGSNGGLLAWLKRIVARA